MYIQYCNGDRDITADFYAEDDATLARVWDEDMPLAEFVPDGDEWRMVWNDGSIDDFCTEEITDSPTDWVERFEKWTAQYV